MSKEPTEKKRKPGPKRRFEQLTEQEQVRWLMNCLHLLLTYDKLPHFTKNPYNLAAQYGASVGMKGSDFDKIKELKIKDIIAKRFPV